MKKSILVILISVMAFSSVFLSCGNGSDKNSGKAPKVEIVPDPTAKK